MWKAAKYLDPECASGFTRIAAFKTLGGETVEEDSRIAEELLKEFFPPAPISTSSSRHSGKMVAPQLEHEPLTLSEIKQAICRAKPDKAAKIDGLPMCVWKELWPALREEVVSFFNASIDTSWLPVSGKMAKIIQLKKPGKGDYAIPKSFRPLLCTLVEALEAVVAERIS